MSSEHPLRTSWPGRGQAGGQRGHTGALQQFQEEWLEEGLWGCRPGPGPWTPCCYQPHHAGATAVGTAGQGHQQGRWAARGGASPPCPVSRPLFPADGWAEPGRWPLSTGTSGGGRPRCPDVARGTPKEVVPLPHPHLCPPEGPHASPPPPLPGPAALRCLSEGRTPAPATSPPPQETVPKSKGRAAIRIRGNVLRGSADTVPGRGWPRGWGVQAGLAWLLGPMPVTGRVTRFPSTALGAVGGEQLPRVEGGATSLHPALEWVLGFCPRPLLSSSNICPSQVPLQRRGSAARRAAGAVQLCRGHTLGEGSAPRRMGRG